ncbi:MAG: DUF739 family protein [Desulfobacteraceae bacterium]|nr:MAG: DUF739 family protein [Desulfobacteraceae bacterium]
MEVDYRLKAKIAEKFGTQWRFAYFLGIDEAIVSKVVNRRQKRRCWLTAERKRAWADALGCRPEEIFED